MAKRFTDPNKWRNPWFRKLPIKAKLAWTFLCDECDFSGIWKADYELASFHLGFPLNDQILIDWFGDKLCIFDGDNVLIIQFFQFQYGTAKDTFMAKIKARERLEGLGFQVVDNKVENKIPTRVGGESPDYPVIGIGILSSRSRRDIQGRDFDFESLYALYPLKKGKAEGLKRCKLQIKSKEDFERLRSAIEAYVKDCAKNQTEAKFIKHFSTFMGSSWRDWLDPDVGSYKKPVTESVVY